MRSIIALGLALTVALALAACSSTASSPTPGATQAPPAAGAAVTIVDFAFQPADLAVKVGDTVTWTNAGNAPHTVKWDVAPAQGSQASDPLAKGGTPYQRTFDAPGTFTYVCGIHGSMKGSITVTE